MLVPTQERYWSVLLESKWVIIACTMCGDPRLDMKIMIKATFLSLIRLPKLPQLQTRTPDHLQTDAIDMKNILYPIATQPLGNLERFTVLFCVANGFVLIIDSGGVPSSQCYKYFISSISNRFCKLATRVLTFSDRHFFPSRLFSLKQCRSSCLGVSGYNEIKVSRVHDENYKSGGF